MTDTERKQTKRWIDAWATAAPVLQQVRDADIRSANTAASMRVFAGSALWASSNRPAEAWSGLVEQQRWFAKAAAIS